MQDATDIILLYAFAGPFIALVTAGSITLLTALLLQEVVRP